MNRDARQSAVLIGSGGFRFERRLTGFRGARNIVRIRTNTPGGDRPRFVDAAGNATRGVVTDLDCPTV
jgi:hypothetical protein